MIASSIVAAAKNFEHIPVVVRLQGTNSAEGQHMVNSVPCSRSILLAAHSSRSQTLA